ncbi:hypothetical protein E5161_17915 [Cohnella pontilimi]|uniref:NIPSNAP domain-containing protein n=1 Tax=Cohnella pontilimi TaxID=2564100 RepID=A0A4V5LRM1_9BACL|nr:hypothetical protein [Cohnella pontilimi]TJY39819.1 hypothetical protein E5161_17915 [Cohnella pontilimi]
MILFCEYVIPELHREAFRRWASEHKELWRTGELLENTAQPGVFVELWRTTGEDEAAQKQKERLEGRSEWRNMECWVKGGREGLRVWTFRPLIPNG